MKKFGIHPLFLMMCVLLALLGQGLVFLNYVLAVAWHEIGHAVVARRLGYSVNKFFLMPYGAGLSFKQNFLDEKDEIWIAAAGPIASFGMAIFCMALWWVVPESFGATEAFAFANLGIGLVNVLPAYPLDGGRVLSALMCLGGKTRKKALRVCFVFNYVLTGLLVCVWALDIKNITVLMFAIFVFLGTFDGKFSATYSLQGFDDFELETPKSGKVHHVALESEAPLYQLARAMKARRLNVVYVVDEKRNVKILTEKQIVLYLKTLPASTKLCDAMRIFEKK